MDDAAREICKFVEWLRHHKSVVPAGVFGLLGEYIEPPAKIEEMVAEFCGLTPEEVRFEFTRIEEDRRNNKESK